MVNGIIYNLCECGECNKYVRNTYARGHNARIQHWAYSENAEDIKATISKAASARTGELSPRYGKTKETNPAFSNSGCPKGTIPWNLGISAKDYLSDEALRNISLGRKGIPAWNSGFKGCHSKETIEKMVHRGADNSWYIDGRSGEEHPYSDEWNNAIKEEVRERDNYRCYICSSPQSKEMTKLSVHHIDYNKKNCDPSNLITLCGRCHTQTNFNRPYWKRFFARIKFMRIREGATTIPKGSTMQAKGIGSARHLFRREMMI